MCLIGVKGKPRRASASVHSVVDTPVEGHSKKPDAVRERIKELCGDSTAIELFARQCVDGWDYWGNEAPQDTERDAPTSPTVSERTITPPRAAESEVVNNACAM